MKTLWFLFLVLLLLLTPDLSYSLSQYEIGCSDATPYNQQYAESLNATFSTLNAASSTAYFSNATSGKAYAAYLCRYDVPLATCQQCVVNSTATAAAGETNTPASCVDGEISYGLCTLHYANRSVSSQLDPTLSSYWCLDAVPNGPFLGRDPVKAAAAVLIDRATAVNASLRYFATGEDVEGSSNRSMYGMVQCAPDINATDCRHCLNVTVRNGLMGCTRNSVPAGFYSYTGSCSVTYSVYPFYKTTSNSSVTPQPLSTALLPASSSSMFGPDIFLSTAVLIVLFLVMEMAQG